jgi:hypothetical protein
VETLQGFLLSHLAGVFFIYGASFFLMSAVIFRRTPPAARSELTDGFLLLAAFGVLHGLTEWTDVVRLLAQATPAVTAAIAVLKLTLLAASFQFLLLFGFHVATASRAEARLRWAIYVAPVLVAVYAYILYMSLQDLQAGEEAVRHSLGFLGALTASYAFLRLAGTLRGLSLGDAGNDALWVAGGFALYAVLAGLATPSTQQPLMIVGLPVQIWRAACAVVISVFVARILRFFRR